VYWESECRGVLLPNQDEMTDKQAFHSLTTVNGAVHFMEDFRQEKICQGIHMRDQRFLDVLTDIQSLVAIFEPHLEVCKFRASYASRLNDFSGKMNSIIYLCKDKAVNNVILFDTYFPGSVIVRGDRTPSSTTRVLQAISPAVNPIAPIVVTPR
jgi:hypothetical protein